MNKRGFPAEVARCVERYASSPLFPGHPGHACRCPPIDEMLGAGTVEHQACKVSPLAIILPRISVAAQPAAVIAAQEVAPQRHMSGYRLHPALTDATLHLSAAALPIATDAKAGPTRVPSGLAAIQAHPLQKGAATVHPAAQPRPPMSDGSVLCNYSMSSAHGCSLQLVDLLAKELGPMPASSQPSDATSTAAVAQDLPESELLYETQWQAVGSFQADAAPNADVLFALEGISPGAGSAGLPTAAYSSKRTKQLGSYGSRFPALPARSARVTAQLGGRGGGNAIAAVTRMLQLWQQAAPCLAGGALHLIAPGTTDSAGGNGQGAAAAAAAVAALLRVAAAENPSVSVTGSELALATPALGQKVCMHPVLAT